MVAADVLRMDSEQPEAEGSGEDSVTLVAKPAPSAQRLSVALAVAVVLAGCAFLTAPSWRGAGEDAAPSRDGRVVDRDTNPVANILELFDGVAKQCGTCSCDCGWATAQPSLCTTGQTTDCCFSCCCNGAGPDAEAAAFGFGAPPGQRAMFASSNADVSSLGHHPLFHPTGASVSYNSAPVHHHGTNFGSHHVVYRGGHFHVYHGDGGGTTVYIWWALLFCVLSVMSCVGLFMFFVPRR
eukprot:CAMPEP_0170346876 /NCGR_PEP_ID=MMETSP0116_2-20130129/74688_1 /TAXON_ID=400756 /ORGANISM="Durinskia baltica, Strain CSIRO CS-38" /LENGTH=238 /DNA_ID=CAMNT_0010600679 /DNA_START=1 /DNA_END=717 /DNA_ORIENTATION=-